MNLLKYVLTPAISILPVLSIAQDSPGIKKQINGFVRTGAFVSEKNRSHSFSAVFSDLNLEAEFENAINFRAVSNLQYRYGSEFGATVQRLDVREAYINIHGKNWDISAGQKILVWGRADFSNPVSKLTPRNYLLRSPDREETDMGNIVAEFNYNPNERLKIQAVLLPVYRSSKLNTDPVPLPQDVKINLIHGLIAEKALSYGIHADFFAKGVDAGLYWFDGYDPMPGIALTKFDINFSGSMPVFSTELSAKPYRMKMAGFDFETYRGPIGLRGEFAWSMPEKDYKKNEHVPLPSLDFSAGIDWSGGRWRIMAEYDGKYMYDYIGTYTRSLIGTEPDLAAYAQLLAESGFDLREFIRQQTASFNRLYNYQLRRLYHSAALQVEADTFHGKLLPALVVMYNYTSQDLLLIPSIKFKPADALTIFAGAEIYNGPDGSLYKLIEDFMSTIYLALRANF